MTNSKDIQMANKKRGLPRNGHDGFREIQKRVQDVRTDFGSREHRNGFIIDYETPYSISTRISPLEKEICRLLKEKAAKGEYDGGGAPVLLETKFYTQRKSEFWCVSATFSKEFV